MNQSKPAYSWAPKPKSRRTTDIRYSGMSDVAKATDMFLHGRYPTSAVVSNDNDDPDDWSRTFKPKPYKISYNFSPAMTGERKVYGANRPGYPQNFVDNLSVQDWIDHVKEKGIKRVVVLLTKDEMDDYYQQDLLAAYKKEFGNDNVLNVPIKDFSIPKKEQFDKINDWIDSSPLKTVVHCSAGLGRTGQVLKNYLMHKYHMTANKAVSAVEKQGRNPREAEFDLASIKNDRLKAFYQKYDKSPERRVGIPDYTTQAKKEYDTPYGTVRSRYEPFTTEVTPEVTPEVPKKTSRFRDWWNRKMK